MTKDVDKMKKVLAVLLAASMTFSLAACSSEPRSNNNESKAQSVVTEEPQEESAVNSGNIFLDAEFKTAPVLSGSGDNIGDYGFIECSKVELTEETLKNLAEFAEEKVEGSGLNWVTAKFEDGTGLCWVGSMSAILNFGKLDASGALTEIEDIYFLKDGAYTKHSETKSETEKAESADSVSDSDAKSGSMTAGQTNALGSAKSYLSYSNFSYDGLIEQLEFEKYENKDAVYAADHCGADWDEQALGSAKSYIDYSAFSYTGLIEQLEFEKYTSEQAKYGADNCGADWNEQAVKAAKNYLDYSSFSHDGLVDQLEYEGFTYEQAVHGVEQNGL